jgi:aryl-alcohol dehydrogenase-like predicted oxidoreductase
MEYRHLGRSGLQVSIVGIGTNNFGGRMDADATALVVNEALDLGINLFDEADIYGGQGKSETFFGQALKGRRHEAVIATKFGNAFDQAPMHRGGSRRWIMESVENSLRRLQTDYIDLYQMHRPDPNTPIEETLRALDDLVRYLGSSNYAGWQLAEAELTARMNHFVPFISSQVEYSLLNREVEREHIPAVERYGQSLLPYYPLASGMLTGKYRAGQAPPAGTRLAGAGSDRWLTEHNLAVVQKLDDWAQAHGHTILELAFSWLATKPYVASVIAGATKPEQVRANASAAEWRLTAEEMTAASRGQQTCNRGSRLAAPVRSSRLDQTVALASAW